jgi:hypothetical protein
MYAFNYIDATNRATLPLPLYTVACFFSVNAPALLSHRDVVAADCSRQSCGISSIPGGQCSLRIKPWMACSRAPTVGALGAASAPAHAKYLHPCRQRQEQLPKSSFLPTSCIHAAFSNVDKGLIGKNTSLKTPTSRIVVFVPASL